MKNEVKKVLLFAAVLLAGNSALAQTPQEDFKRDITLSASNYVAYRGPQKQLTPAPKGYKPFYLSHYGRHGSRYMKRRPMMCLTSLCSRRSRRVN